MLTNFFFFFNDYSIFVFSFIPPFREPKMRHSIYVSHSLGETYSITRVIATIALDKMTVWNQTTRTREIIPYSVFAKVRANKGANNNKKKKKRAK